jgi:hypothetical protein
VNEISVSEIALARQAGDEAGHFQLVADRLAALGFELAGFRPPGANPLFGYLRSLSTTVERLAAGLFTLESIAYAVNENFMAFCHQRGDAETVRVYREYMAASREVRDRAGVAAAGQGSSGKSPPDRHRRPSPGRGEDGHRLLAGC